MDSEEYVQAQRVIAEGHTSLVVKALEESIEGLRGEIEFLKEENKRLRNTSRATRTTNRKVRRDVSALVEQVEEMGQHIMDIAAEEQEFVDGEPPIESYPNIKMFECIDGEFIPLQKRFKPSPDEHAVAAEKESKTRDWLEKEYQELRQEGTYPANLPLSPDEVYASAKQRESDSASKNAPLDGTKTA